MSDPEFLLQNCHDLPFETKQIASFSRDQCSRVNLLIASLSSETEQEVDVRRRNLKGLDLGNLSICEFVNLPKMVSRSCLEKVEGRSHVPSLRQT